MRRTPGAPRRGSVLLLVLVVVAVLTLGVGSYLQLMQTELTAVRQHGRHVQAQRLCESAVEYLKATLALTPAELQAQGGLLNNPAKMQGLLADERPDAFDRGRFTIVAPAQIDGRYSGYRFGVESESAKLNLNVLLAEGAEPQAASRLLALPGMTPETADAILDWLDRDDAPRPFGAERDFYGQATPPYEPRNGPLPSVDELLLVRGVTPEMLYGLDLNRNLVVDAGETPRGKLTAVDNSEGYFNRGWSAFLTVSSVETLGGAGGAAAGQVAGSAAGSAAASASGPIDLNSADLRGLYSQLQTALDDERAKFIIVYRQYGSAGGSGGDGGARGSNPSAASGGSGTIASTASTQSTSSQEASAGRPATGPAAGGANAAARPTKASALQLSFEQQAGTPINSLLELVGAQVQVPGGDQNSPPQSVASPWEDAPAGYRDLLRLYDVAAAGATGRIAGRINLNAATRPVLRTVPGLSAGAISQIVAQRELEPDRAISDQRHAIWPLVQGIVTLAEMRALERYVTAGGDAFSGQAVGFFDAGPTASRGEFVLERGSPPRLRAWRDMAPWGPGFVPVDMGAQGEGLP